MIKQAMILAAGRGQRMMPLTADCPKPLLLVAETPLIEYHIRALVTAGVEHIVINHAWLGDMIVAALGDGSRFDTRITYSPETEALETAGGIVNALPLLDDGPFWLVNGDVFCDFDFSQSLPNNRDVQLMMVDNPEHNLSGDFYLDEGQLSLASGKSLTYAGLGIYTPKFFAGLAPGVRPLAPLLREAINQQRVGAFHYRGEWWDIGTPQRLAQLNQSKVS